MGDKTSTLVASEAMMAPATLAVQCLCSTMGLLALGASTSELARGLSSPGIWLAWSLCLALWAWLTASNVRYVLEHARPTIGMIPIAVISLAPACVAALLAPHLRASFFWLIVVALVVSCATLAFVGFWFRRLGATYAGAPAPDPDATIIVLGGSVRGGRPCRTLVRRLEVALGLWSESPDRTLVLTGGRTVDGCATEAEVMAEYLEERGVAHKALLLEDQARNTRQNVELSLDLVRKRGIGGQLCVLTSDYHLYRAVAEGRRRGVELVPIPAPTPPTSRLQQWCREALTILVSR